MKKLVYLLFLLPTLLLSQEGIENIPASWQARETYSIINQNEIIETFELAAPRKEFDVYSQTHLRRKQ